MPKLLSEQENGLVFTVHTGMIKLYHVQIIDKIVGMSHCCPGLVKNDYSQVDFINNDFRSLSSAGPLTARCSKTVKYIVKGGIIGSEYVSYYTVVAC